MSLLCGQGMVLPPKAMPLRMSFNSRSEAVKLGFFHGFDGSARSFKVIHVDHLEIVSRG